MWLMLAFEGADTQVMPVEDLREHEPSGDCWCCPVLDEEYGIWVHPSLDGREAFEDGLRQAS